MNRKAHIIQDNLQLIVNCVKDRPRSTDYIIENIAKTTSLTRRQIFRYLNLALDHGLLIRPLRGYYSLPDESIPNFEDFKSDFVDMSLTTQHNKTETLTLTETVDLILETACIECTTEDRKRIEYIMSHAEWTKVTFESVSKYCEETWNRFSDSIKKYDVKFSARYFFGILRRVLCTTIEDMQRFYKKFLEKQAERKRLMEQGEEHQAAVNPNSDEEKTSDNVISEEWRNVEETIAENANEHGLAKPKTNLIRNVVSSLEKSMFNPLHVMNSLSYMVTNDIRGFCYMVRNLSSFETVTRCLEKNYDRYLSTLYTPGETTVEAHKSERDSRYDAFYELFPNL